MIVSGVLAPIPGLFTLRLPLLLPELFGDDTPADTDGGNDKERDDKDGNVDDDDGAADDKDDDEEEEEVC